MLYNDISQSTLVVTSLKINLLHLNRQTAAASSTRFLKKFPNWSALPHRQNNRSPKSGSQ